MYEKCSQNLLPVCCSYGVHELHISDGDVIVTGLRTPQSEYAAQLLTGKAKGYKIKLSQTSDTSLIPLPRASASASTGARLALSWQRAASSTAPTV